MARGRELLVQKVSGAERNEIRFKEVEDGKIPMPREPRTLYVLSGTSFDGAKVQDRYAHLGVEGDADSAAVVCRLFRSRHSRHPTACTSSNPVSI
jgi:hypothetical protein